MTKNIYICDQCGKKTDWLYTLPAMHKEGLRIEVMEGTTEVCEKCLDIDLDLYREKVCYVEEHPDYEE